MHARRTLAWVLPVLAITTGALAPVSAASPATSLTFAAYNVCKATCDSPAPAWDTRRTKVARVIAASGADVIALSEATNQPVGSKQIPWKNGDTRTVSLNQWEDLQALTAAAGYVAPTLAGVTCEEMYCTHTARILFNASTVRQTDLGTYSSAGDATLGDVTGTGTVGADRQMAWAYLERADGSHPFLAISAHLDNDKSASAEQARVAFGRGIDAWIQRLNAERGLPSSLPVVLLGDLNSFDARQPRGVQHVLGTRGWDDSWNAPKRRNIDINSVNYSDTMRSGWPDKPIRNPSGVASRIDYILFKGSGMKATSYGIDVHLDSHGRFASDYRASDHNLVRAVLSF